jgi:hypothetical protein
MIITLIAMEVRVANGNISHTKMSITIDQSV